jgi:16S rRNA (uracil1498-N3)-methyltransferase
MMSLPIFYIDTFIETQILLTLSEETSKHIVQVLRMNQGEQLQLTDGKGHLITAEITDNHKKKCQVKIIAIQKNPPPQKRITIAISLVKNASRFEWFLEKATELGANLIIPMLCQRTEKQYFRIERMNGILISAMLQSKQVWLPELQIPTPFKEVIKNANENSKFIAHCEADKEKIQLASIHKKEAAIILIGPEGDFSSEEISLAINCQFMPVALGETRLRTETAGIVAATILNLY